MNLAAALLRGSSLCRLAGVDTPRLDAEVLLARCLAKDRGRLFAAAKLPLSPEVALRFRRMIRRRCAGEPVAYLCGEKEFFGLPFRVDPSVLVPRPETEGIVERAERLRRAFGGRRLVDVGTGCGNIAVAARLCAGYEAVAATELAADALEVARENSRRLKARIDFFSGDLLEPVVGTAWEGRTDVVCSNPPYVKRADLASLPPEVRREPRMALDGGVDGLAVVRRLLLQAPTILREGGHVIVEIGDDQGNAVRGLAETAGYAGVRIEQDLGGRDRYLVARMRGGIPARGGGAGA